MGGLGLCVVLDGPLGGGRVCFGKIRSNLCQHLIMNALPARRDYRLSAVSQSTCPWVCAWSEHSPKGWAPPPRPKPKRLGPVIPRTEALACVVKSPGSVGRDISRRLPLHSTPPILSSPLSPYKNKTPTSIVRAGGKRPHPNARNRYRKLLSPSFHLIPSSSIHYPRSQSAILRTRSSKERTDPPIKYTPRGPSPTQHR